MSVVTEQSPSDTAIDPFEVEIAQTAIDGLRTRLAETRWPSPELVADRSQGVQLTVLQELASYWATEYDWRRAEAKLNSLPQFTTEIDGVEVHFVHVRPTAGGAPTRSGIRAPDPPP